MHMTSNECALVNDLLPLYIEQAVSPQAEIIIQNHLQSCAACQETYKAMTATLPNVHTEQHPEAPIQQFQKSFKKKLWRSVIAVICIVSLLWSLFSLWFLQPALHGFEKLDAHVMQVSVTDTTTTITIDATAKQRDLYYMYALNPDHTLTLYLSYGSLLTQYIRQRHMTAAGISDHSETWYITPDSVRISDDLMYSDEGGARTSTGATGAAFTLNEAAKIILTSPVRNIYYVPDLPTSIFDQYRSAMENATKTLSEDSLNPGSHPVSTDTFDFSQLTNLITLY